jgi:hypothetical protein
MVCHVGVRFPRSGEALLSGTKSDILYCGLAFPRCAPTNRRRGGLPCRCLSTTLRTI